MAGIIQQVFTGSSASDGAVAVLATPEIGARTFFLMASQGTVRVLGTLNGADFSSALALVDLTAVDNLPVTSAEAGKPYAFYGPYKTIRVEQVGATAVVGLTLIGIEE